MMPKIYILRDILKDCFDWTSKKISRDILKTYNGGHAQNSIIQCSQSER